MIKNAGCMPAMLFLLLYAAEAAPALAYPPGIEKTSAEQPFVQSSVQSKDSLQDPFTVYREAGVSAEQQAQIRELAGEFEKMARVKTALLRNLAKQLQEASFEPELDEKKILGLQEEMNQLQVTLNSERIKLMLKIRQLLNPDQKIKLVQIMKERTGRPLLPPASAGTP